MQPHIIQSQPHDYLSSRMHHTGESLTALRLNDALHEHVQVGDVVEMHGHGDIMDRQRYKVVSRMDHPTLNAAISSAEHSNLAVRDRIKLADSFREVHAPHIGGAAAASNHPVVSFQLHPVNNMPSHI